VANQNQTSNWSVHRVAQRQGQRFSLAYDGGDSFSNAARRDVVLNLRGPSVAVARRSIHDRPSSTHRPMFDYDKVLGDAIFEYCRQRLIEDPVPLDYGSLLEYDESATRRPHNRTGPGPVEALEFFRRELAPSVISTDSPAFLAFIPNAQRRTRCSLTWSCACSGLNGTSWLESAGVVRAENQALSFLAERAGMANYRGRLFHLRGVRRQSFGPDRGPMRWSSPAPRPRPVTTARRDER
jgi:hypothetical protein